MYRRFQNERTVRAEFATYCTNMAKRQISVETLKYLMGHTDISVTSNVYTHLKLEDAQKEIERLENELKMVSYHLTKGEQLEAILNSTFKQMEDITDVHEMTNIQLKRLIQKIEVDKGGNVDIYLRLIGNLGLDETVLIEGTENIDERVEGTEENSLKTTINKTIPNRTNRT